jgi:YVTN family beta-propeller protein
VTAGYSGVVSRLSYNAAASTTTPVFVKRPDIQVGGLVNGVAEDPATHRIAVARTAMHEVVVLDDKAGKVIARLHAGGQPFSVGFASGVILATLFDGDRVDAWRSGTTAPVAIQTGPHPTQLMIDRDVAYIANADGHDVAVLDTTSLRVSRRFDLALAAPALAGQTPSGMAISNDRKTLFVAESGLNDVAVVDTSTGAVSGRIPTGWYPMGVAFLFAPTIDKDPRSKPQLFVLNAQGLGTQPDPAAEWDGWYTGFIQTLVVEPDRFAQWSAQVAKNDLLAGAATLPATLPPIKHVVFIVRENKHFDEEFGDEAAADADPNLLLYGRKYTPNIHALGERYALFDEFFGNGESSDYGHSWTTQGIANDYLERSVHTPDDPANASVVRIAGNIWPVSTSGEDTLTPAQMDFDWFKDLADLPHGPRVNVSAVFGPRGQLIDELQRKGVSYRVYGEQMTMQSDGRIAPGLATHADREYPGAHINFQVLDTARASLFLADVAAHGLAAYSYMTLPTDHTAGTKPGFYTPASYVADNDVALGRIVEGLSKRPEWQNTIVIVIPDDPQGTGDHVDSHRMPVFAVGPYIRKSFVDHTHYSIPSVLRTVEVLYGLSPLNIYDAGATPLVGAFADTPDTSPYSALPATVPMTKNPGKPKTMSLELDGPESRMIPRQEWESIKGRQSADAHDHYLRYLSAVAAAFPPPIWDPR